ncbi:unnamed protein product [Phytophthora fragariaefolia]|uniref:Unnamed protein product n=1 Tax=Phytophthora fragariaefolia TaxID=1490495 RepID=A0A9W7D2K6_9STRA|nr:unnamed protein product [Phytophthora fragariaefolia]
MFRGFGNEADAAMGFALWERDHWVPTQAVEAYFEVAYRAIEDSFDKASRPALQSSVDAAKDRWLAYVQERALTFEPSMPGFSLEHLMWAPKTADWVSELAELEERV